MTDLAQPALDVESSSGDDEVDDRPVEKEAPVGDRGPRFDAHQVRMALAWVGGGVVVALVIAWMVLLSPGNSGSTAEWFFGAAVFTMALVTVWQTQLIARRAAGDAAEAAERLRTELAAAEVRAARQLAWMRSLHETEMEAQRELARAELEAHRNVARAELEAQRDVARGERDHLLAQLQKSAITEVSRAVSAHTHMLATLWDEGARILALPDRDDRGKAMQPIFDKIAQVVKDFSVEIANAQLLIADDRLQEALARINDAVLTAMEVAEEVHGAVVEGQAPDPNPVPAAQRLLYERAAEARHLAWELLRTGLAAS